MHTGVQQQKTIKQTNEAVIRLDLEKKQAVRKADREHRTMLQYKTLLAESKTPLLLAQKEIASLQKELETQLNDARNTMDKYLRDYDTLYQRTQKLTEDLEEQITKNQQQHLEGSWSASFFTPSTRLVLIRECAGCFFERF